HQNRRVRGKSSSLRRNRTRRESRVLARREFSVERLEDRQMLSATQLDIGVAAPPDPVRVAQAQLLVGAASATSLQVAPFALDQTFLLHSDPGATKTVYLDFKGFITRNTQWNSDYGLPNIVTPAYSLDGDFTSFSDIELEQIQLMWEHVSEDYRPFDVD